MKRLIGIDVGIKTLRLAVLGKEQGELRVLALEEIIHESTEEQVAGLLDFFGQEFLLGDRIAACLPAGRAFIRQLSFPFHERKKIAAALDYELAGQLPVPLDNYMTFMQPPVRKDDGAEVVAAAVKKEQLAEFIKPFDEQGIPLQVLDLAPHAYVAGLRGILENCILGCLGEHETTLVVIENGNVSAFRQLPKSANRAEAICREVNRLHRTTAMSELPIFLAGSEASPGLVDEMSAKLTNVEMLSISIGNEMIDASFIPAVAMALRAAENDKIQSFNLRRGPFKLKGEWGGLRKAMIVAACLAGLAVITFGVSMGLEYSAKRRQLNALQEQMSDIYRRTIPGAGQIVDVPLQLQSAIRQLQEEAGMIAMQQPSTVTLLRQLSDLPDGLSVDLEEFAFDQGLLRVSGKTDTFETVNRMAEHYRSDPLFGRVDVTESKMGSIDRQVSFRMSLTINEEGGQE